MFALFPRSAAHLGDPMPVDIRSFPLALGAHDVTLVRRQMWKDEVGTNAEP
jgi:hypothetical protein